MTAGLCAGFTLAFMIFSKIFPIVSIWELDKEETSASKEDKER
jgi:hypothetical protein